MQSQSQLPKVSTRLGLFLLESLLGFVFFSENESLGSASFISLIHILYMPYYKYNTKKNYVSQTINRPYAAYLFTWFTV